MWWFGVDKRYGLSLYYQGTVSAALRAAGLPCFLPSVEFYGGVVQQGVDLTFGAPFMGKKYQFFYYLRSKRSPLG